MYDNVILWPTVTMAMTLRFDTEAKETARYFVYPFNASIQNLIQFKVNVLIIYIYFGLKEIINKWN